MQNKLCTTCHQEKPLGEFVRRGGGKLSNRCKACQLSATAASRAKHPGTGLAWRRAHRLEINARSRVRSARYRERRRQAQADALAAEAAAEGEDTPDATR